MILALSVLSTLLTIALVVVYVTARQPVPKEWAGLTSDERHKAILAVLQTASRLERSVERQKSAMDPCVLADSRERVRLLRAVAHLAHHYQQKSTLPVVEEDP